MWTLVKTASTPMLLSATPLHRQTREDAKMRKEVKDKTISVCLRQGEPEHVPIVRLTNPRNERYRRPDRGAHNLGFPRVRAGKDCGVVCSDDGYEAHDGLGGEADFEMMLW